MSAFEKLIDALRAHGDNVNENGDKARAHCPAHNGTSDDSLAIGPRDDGKGIVVYCHAGCDLTDVLAALNLTKRDLFDDAAFQNVWNPFAKYKYPGGRQVNRKGVDANGKKIFDQSGNKKDRSLFHSDRIGAKTMVIYVVEGEKDVLAVEAIGQVAVCSAMGADKAHIADWSPLTDKHAIIIADNDDPGLNHAEDIRDILDGIARTVSVVKAAVGKDVSDHIAAGKKLSELVRITGFDATVPIPLTGFVSLVSFPVGSFPNAIADMIIAVAEATQTDLAMAGTAAISALSACAGGNVEIQIRTAGSNRCVPTAWSSPTLVNARARCKGRCSNRCSTPRLSWSRQSCRAMLMQSSGGTSPRRPCRLQSRKLPRLTRSRPNGTKPRMMHSAHGMLLTTSTFHNCHGWSPTMSHPRLPPACCTNAADQSPWSPPRATCSTSSPAATAEASRIWVFG